MSDDLTAEMKIERITAIWQKWYHSNDCSGVSAMAEIGELLPVNTDDKEPE